MLRSLDLFFFYYYSNWLSHGQQLSAISGECKYCICKCCYCNTDGCAASPLGPVAFIIFHLLHHLEDVSYSLIHYHVCRCKWMTDCMFMCFPSWLLCRPGSVHCSASWQSQTRSQWPLEQGSVLELRRLLASVRWTQGTDPQPCPLGDKSPSGSVCWTTQRSSLTSRWVVKSHFLMEILMSDWESSLLHNSQEAFPRFHDSSSSLVTGWHGNCMMLSCWMHG